MDIRDVLQQYSVPTQEAPHRNVRAGWIGVDCPSCSPGQGKYRLGFELTTGRCTCWVCGLTNPAKALVELCSISLATAIEITKGTRQQWAPTETTTGVLQLPKAGELLPAHRNYLQGRGYDPDAVADLWGAQGIGPLGGKLAWRILIPIHTRQGRVVSWTTRAIRQDAPLRYVSAAAEEESVSHKSLLYGAHKAGHTIIVHEGSLDVWSTGPGAVATMGISYSDAQMAAMGGFPNRVICFDSEALAQKRAQKLCRDLSVLPGTTVNVYLETGKDSSEADRDEIAELRATYLE